jgi:hypothetical protein
MMLGALLISGREWVLPVSVLCGAILFVLLLSYRRSGLNTATLAGCAGLKLAGCIALGLTLLDPLWTSQRARPGSNYVAILADNSQGMQIRDAGAERSRGEELRDFLTADQPPWRPRLEETFQVRDYLFDSRLQSSRGFGEMDFTGRSTAIGGALRGMAERFRGQPLAGILLFTDGNATDLLDGQINLEGLPPIYPVLVGKDEPIRDLAVQRVVVSQSAFEDAPVTLQADVTVTGYPGEVILAQVLNPDGKILQEETVRVTRAEESAAFRFQIKPASAGVSFYQVRVRPRAEAQVFARPEDSSEATLANNIRIVAVDRKRGPYRILYVAGRPNWDYKFLNRALEEDDQVDLVALIRIARREPKFEFKGRRGESSNPLFRGFDRTTEETERYDKPVLKRLNVRDGLELQSGFPKTAEELYSYHAVILDDLEAEFFTHDQMMLLQKFVSERGGGFLMMGGQESFHNGQYARTPVGEMLPVYLDRLVPGTAGNYLRLDLTRDGWLQPWARLRGTEAEERGRLQELTPFQVLNRVRGIKPAASEIATVTDLRGNSHPALVTQRFGQGRTAALMIGDFWRAGLDPDESKSRDLAKAWRQVMRWMVADVPEQYELMTEPVPGDPNQAISLNVRVRDRTFQPLETGSVRIQVKSLPSGAEAAPGEIRLMAEASDKDPGLYHASYVPRETGGYLAEAVIQDASGIEIGRATAGWTANPAADEFQSLKPNRALLEKIARETGGEVLIFPRLNEFAARLPHRAAPITESWSRPLWHTPWVFLFALCCFAAEWGLRRWKGLA